MMKLLACLAFAINTSAFALVFQNDYWLVNEIDEVEETQPAREIDLQITEYSDGNIPA
jgi:hypothetical protein